MNNLPIKHVKNLLLCLARDKNVTPQQIEAFFLKFLLKKPLPIINEFDYPFLVRSSPNDPGEVFKNVKRCSYNPNSLSIKLQRCNYPEQQVFYASVPADGNDVSAQMTALLETSLDIVKNKKISRKYYTLSRWQISRPLCVIVLPFSKRSCSRNPHFKRMNNEFKLILKELCKNDLDRFQYYYDFLSCISTFFCKNNKKEVYYKITSAYCNAVFKLMDNEHYGKIDGIVYPSANTKAEGMNIVLKKKLIDSDVIYCDITVMSALLRAPNNPREITYPIVSNESCPDRNGNLLFNCIL